MTERVLVTGGAGYLGSILCEHLLAAGYRVTVVDNLLYGQAPLSNMTFIDLETRAFKELFPGIRIRTFWGAQQLLSFVSFAAQIGRAHV